MDYINKDLFKSGFYYLIIAAIGVLILSSTFFILKLAGMAIIIVAAVWLFKKGIFFIKRIYEGFKAKNYFNKWEIVNNKEEDEFSTENKIIIDVEYEEV